MKYKIISAETASELEVEVNLMMDKGWQPVGLAATGVVSTYINSEYSIHSASVDTKFYQAMIHRPAPKPPGTY